LLLPLRLRTIIAYYVLPAGVAMPLLFRMTQLPWWASLALCAPVTCIAGSLMLYLIKLLPASRVKERSCG
jgi:hypothetical protein